MHIDAKKELNLRSLQYWGACIGVFVAWAILMAALLPAPFQWVADAVGIAVAYYILFHFLEQRPLLIACPTCKKTVTTNTPWVCGFCGFENQQANEFPFIEPCERCRATPKAYRCHHKRDKIKCEGFIFLSPDEQEENHAYCLNSEMEAAPPDKSVIRKGKKEKIADDIEMAELKENLNAIRQRSKKIKEKPAKERLKEDFQKDCDVWLSAEDEAEEQRKMAKEKYKDNPERLQKALDLIEAWARKHTPE